MSLVHQSFFYQQSALSDFAGTFFPFNFSSVCVKVRDNFLGISLSTVNGYLKYLCECYFLVNSFFLLSLLLVKA